MKLHSSPASGVTDLSPLQDIATLRELTVDFSTSSAPPLASLDAVGQMKGLQRFSTSGHLGLLDAPPLDLSPLQGLQELQGLTVIQRKLQGVETLAALETLRYLDLSRTDLTSLEAIAGLRIDKLHLSDSMISEAQLDAYRTAHPNTEVDDTTGD